MSQILFMLAGYVRLAMLLSSKPFQNNFRTIYDGDQVYAFGDDFLILLIRCVFQSGSWKRGLRAAAKRCEVSKVLLVLFVINFRGS